MSKFDSATFYANVGNKLLDAQRLLESYIETFHEACIVEAEMHIIYRKNRASSVKHERERGTPATLIADIVKGDVAEDKANYLKATAQKNKVKYYIDAMKERIFNIRHLSTG